MTILQELLTKKAMCGMMPHPERALETLLGTDSGVKLFEAMVKSWRNNMSKFIEPSVEEIKLEKYIKIWD